MLTNDKNVKVENTNEVKVDHITNSMAMMNELLGSKVMVKPVLPEGHYNVEFKGVSFVEVMHKGKKVMAARFTLADKTHVYEEDFALYAETEEARAAILGQLKRYIQQIAEQFELIGVDVSFEDLNKYIGHGLGVKVYMHEFTHEKTGKSCHARRIGFWAKPVEVPQTTPANVPSF
jgi:hypothetical protein